MLGLVDFFRAVRNTAGLALRRVHPLAGPVLIGVIWVVALGSVLWITREEDDGSSTDDAASYTEREVAGTRDAGRDDGGDGGGGSDGVGQVEWTDGTDGSSGDGDGAGDDGSGGEADGADDEGGPGGDDPTLESPGGPGRVTPPTSTGTPPSWDPQEPEEPGPGEPGPGEPGPTTTPTTTPATSGPTTSTTVPAGGGLLDVLLGILFP